MSQTGDYESLVNPHRKPQALHDAAVISDEFPEPAKAGEEPAKVIEIGAVDGWNPRNGHLLTFIGLFIFSVILYFRPYELIPSLSSITNMAFIAGVVTLCIYVPSQFVLEGNLTARPREINLILLFLLTAFLSMPLATSPGEAYTTFTDVLLKAIVIFIVIVNVIRTESRLKLLIWLVFAVSLYLSINAISDYSHGIFREGSAYYNDQRIGGTIGGLFGNSNDMALHLVTMVPLAVGFAFVTKGLLRKLLFIGLAVLFVSGIVVTFSRGGFLGLFIAALVLTRKIGRRNKFLSTAALVVAMLALLIFAPGSYTGRLSTIFNSAADATGSSSQRTEILKRSIWVTLRYPVFGVGIGNFHYKSVQELVTHNAYTQVSSEMGIPALVIYVMLMVYPLRRLREIESQTENRADKRKFYYLSIGIQTSIIAYMVSSFFASVAYQWYIYYLVGYAVALRRLYYLDQHAERQT
ncbi:MAG TPA: O-antigen ligase family protein [Pyrinomonadaceae bacterium]|nr:O-antigen ligase family protein [Pyrinomonadaceae bacterium]